MRVALAAAALAACLGCSETPVAQCYQPAECPPGQTCSAAGECVPTGAALDGAAGADGGLDLGRVDQGQDGRGPDQSAPDQGPAADDGPRIDMASGPVACSVTSGPRQNVQAPHQVRSLPEFAGLVVSPDGQRVLRVSGLADQPVLARCNASDVLDGPALGEVQIGDAAAISTGARLVRTRRVGDRVDVAWLYDDGSDAQVGLRTRRVSLGDPACPTLLEGGPQWPMHPYRMGFDVFRLGDTPYAAFAPPGGDAPPTVIEAFEGARVEVSQYAAQQLVVLPRADERSVDVFMSFDPGPGDRIIHAGVDVQAGFRSDDHPPDDQPGAALAFGTLDGAVRTPGGFALLVGNEEGAPRSLRLILVGPDSDQASAAPADALAQPLGDELEWGALALHPQRDELAVLYEAADGLYLDRFDLGGRRLSSLPLFDAPERAWYPLLAPLGEGYLATWLLDYDYRASVVVGCQ